MSNRELTMAVVMQPYQANVSGNVHGGEIMKFMDNVAAATARQYSKENVVTARVDELDFHLPIYIGSYVKGHGKIAYVGSSSMEVVVSVEVENLLENEGPKLAIRANFTMVAVDKDRNPKKIKPWYPESEEEKKEYNRIMRRREAHLKQLKEDGEIS